MHCYVTIQWYTNSSAFLFSFVNFLYSYIAMLLSINNRANNGFNFMGQPSLIGMVSINDHIVQEVPNLKMRDRKMKGKEKKVQEEWR